MLNSEINKTTWCIASLIVQELTHPRNGVFYPRNVMSSNINKEHKIEYMQSTSNRAYLII